MLFTATIISSLTRSRAAEHRKLQLLNVSSRSDTSVENGTHKVEYSKLLNGEEDNDSD